MIIIDLIYNLSVLVALSVLSGFIDSRYDRNTSIGKILQGTLFGIVAIIGMQYPFILEKGIIFDGRSIVISLCTLFFGPISGLISSILAVIFRYYIGGGGILTGSLVITASFLIGYLFHINKVKRKFYSTKVGLYSFGFLVSAVMMGLMLTLPTNFVGVAYRTITATVMIFYPLITMLIGKVLLDHEENKNYLDKINQEKNLYLTTLYSIGDGVITTDIKGAVKQMNHVAEQLTGWKESEAKGKLLEEIFKIIDEDNRNIVSNSVEKVLREGKVIGLANHTLLISKKGNEIPIADSGAPIKNQHGEITGVVLVFHDQTGERAKQKAILKSEEEFRNFFENSPLGKSIIGIDGSVKVNKSFCEMLGYSKDELLNKKWEELTHRDDNQKSKDVETSLLNGEEANARFEKRYIHKNGNEIWAEVNITLQRDAQGNPKFFITTVNNITKRKRAEELLKESEEKFRSIMENSADAIFITDTNGYYLYTNKAVTAMLGYTAEEMKNKTITDIAPKNRIDEVIKIFKRCQSEGKVFAEFELTKKDGSNISTDLNSVVLPGGLIYGSCRDISKRKQAEKEIKMLAHSLESISECVSITDDKDIILYVNESFFRTYGYSKGELIGKHTSILRPHNITQENLIEILPGTIIGGWKGEIINQRKDGSLFPILLSTSVVKDENEKPIALIGVAMDITEMKKNREELIAAKEKAEKSDKLKTEFLAQMSHEIRSPMNVALSFTELIKEEFKDVLSPQLADYIAGIEDAGKRLIRTVELILNASEMQVGTYQPTWTTVDLMSEILNNISRDYSNAANQKGLQLTLTSRISDPKIFCDKYSVNQIFINLVDNAIKYTKEGTVDIIVDKNEENKVKVIVEDTGIGMSEEFMAVMYDIFMQEERGYSRRYEGNGLGLSLIKKYCDLNKAVITVESGKKKGTKFIVTFPQDE
ncbi:MAG: PAS domain S-box protein [Melioribacteraceae bacterium]